MVTPDNVRSYIAAGLPCEHLEVTGDGQHFEAVIVATAFDGKRLIQRHQLVYKALGDRMREEIHALSMRTLTPAEFATQFPSAAAAASAASAGQADSAGAANSAGAAGSAGSGGDQAAKTPAAEFPARRGIPVSIPIKGV